MRKENISQPLTDEHSRVRYRRLSKSAFGKRGHANLEKLVLKDGPVHHSAVMIMRPSMHFVPYIKPYHLVKWWIKINAMRTFEKTAILLLVGST